MLRAATRVAARHARRAPPRRRALAAVQYVPAQTAGTQPLRAPVSLDVINTDSVVDGSEEEDERQEVEQLMAQLQSLDQFQVRLQLIQ